VVVSAANPELILLPGMTANVRIVTAQKDKVLKVANAALRFKPPAANAAGNDEKSAPATRQPGAGSGMGRGRGGGVGKLWVVGADGQPAALEVKTGINDGNQTELLEGDLAEGREVIVGMSNAAEKSRPTQPRMF
jgi:HlyD family secretion protein